MDAAAPATADRPSWNPLRVSGTALAPNVLLAAKLIALSLLLTNHQARLPNDSDLLLPAFLDALRDLFPFAAVIQGIFFGATAALLLNRWVRAAALTLGGVMLIAVVGSTAYSGRDALFCGLFLVLVGLQEPGREPWLLRWQIVLVYAGAALGQALDPDWLSGRFFERWGRYGPERPLFIALSDALPPLVVGKLFGWATLAAEAALAAGFLSRRLWPLAIWLGVGFHSVAFGFTGSAFPLFFYAALASYLVFAPWPQRPLEVFYDGDCSFCEATRRRFERLDPDRVYAWKPFQEGGWERYGMTAEALVEKLHVVADGRVTAGFRAFQTMLLYNPLSYFAAAGLLAAAGGGGALIRNTIVALGIALFFPPLRPLGEAAYALVARNRHRLPGDGACKVR